MKKIYPILILILAIIALSGCIQAPDNVEATKSLDEIVSEVLQKIEDLAEEETPVTSTPEVLTPTFATTLQETLVDLYEKANPAVVTILVPPFGGGTGFLYDTEGHIVTNNHVVSNGDKYEVVFSSGDRFYADLVGNDVDSDLAVLKVEGIPEGVEPLVLAEPNSITVGQFVIAIGNPFGEQGSMTFGIVSGLGRSLPSQRILEYGSSYSLPQVIQTDAPINPGNSGGPLLNLSGEVLGVNSAIASTTGVGSGVGFAIPVAALHRIVPKLIENGEYSYPYMGVLFDNEVSLEDLEAFGVPQTNGAYIVRVNDDSPAETAGLVGADQTTGVGGDLIVDIDGTPIRNFSDLNSYLVFNAEVGQTITITVLRNGEKVSLDLTLGERP